LHSEETIHEIVVPSYVHIHLWRRADFDDLSPHLAVDITDMTADGRPSSFVLALEARHIHSNFLGRLGSGCDCCCSDCFRSAF
jgi:hypothetical protein